MRQINDRGGRSDNSGRNRLDNRAKLTGTTAIPNAPHCLAFDQDEQLLTPRKLAARWQKADKTLANDRSLKRGCKYIQLGRHVRYRLWDVLAYEVEHTQSTASDEEISQ